MGGSGFCAVGVGSEVDVERGGGVRARGDVEGDGAQRSGVQVQGGGVQGGGVQGRGDVRADVEGRVGVET